MAAALLPEVPEAHVRLRVLLGTGGYAEVYAGEVIGTPCVLKILRARRPGGGGGVPAAATLGAALEREAALMQRVQCPHVVAVVGLSTVRGHRVLIMEPMELTLQALMEDARVALPRVHVLRIARDVARGLLWLHMQPAPIVHRDVKPENILLRAAPDGGYVAKIADLGMAVALEPGSRRAARPGGTPAYMAPEALLLLAGEATRGEAALGTAVDVYAFGMVLHELLHRRREFLAHSRAELVRRVAHEHARPRLDAVVAAAHPDLVALASRCWAADAAARPTMQQVLAELERLLQPLCAPCARAEAFWELASPVSPVVLRGALRPLLARYLERVGDPARADPKLPRRLRALLALAAPGGGAVHREHLMRLARHLGPIDRLGSWGAFLDECARARRWLRPACGADDTRKELALLPPRGFFVRYSRTDGCFTLCARDDSRDAAAPAPEVLKPADTAVEVPGAVQFHIAREPGDRGGFLAAPDGPAFARISECVGYMARARNLRGADWADRDADGDDDDDEATTDDEDDADADGHGSGDTGVRYSAFRI